MLTVLAHPCNMGERVRFSPSDKEKCEKRIYLIMMRGCNNRTIFEDEEDYNKHLQVLKERTCLK